MIIIYNNILLRYYDGASCTTQKKRELRRSMQHLCNSVLQVNCKQNQIVVRGVYYLFLFNIFFIFNKHKVLLR